MRRILFVSCYFATDYGGAVWGAFLRMRMLLEAASRVADSVDLLLFAAPDMISGALPAAIADSIRRAWGIRVAVLLAPRAEAGSSVGGLVRSLRDVRFVPDYRRAGGAAQAAAVRAAIRDDTDLVIAKSLESALAVAACRAGGVASLIDIDDIEHIAFDRRTRQLPWSIERAIGRLRMRAVERGEMETIDVFDTGFVCSEADRRHLERRRVRPHIEIVPNAVRFTDHLAESRLPGTRTILYFGNYAYRPNLYAAEELIDEVFPRILERVPDASLLIAGSFADKLPSFGRSRPRTRIVGYVEDVADVYRQAAIACCPIRAGGGTRIKIIEASAWKIPTVSTAIGAEGLDLEPGREILIADEPEALAQRCVELFESPERARAIGEAAYRKAKAVYDHPLIVGRVADFYRAAAETPRRRPR